MSEDNGLDGYEEPLTPPLDGFVEEFDGWHGGDEPLPPSESPNILDDMSSYIEELSYRYNVVNVVLIIAIAYVLANVISIFKVNINY